jgi:arginyl-tRNA synthetase
MLCLGYNMVMKKKLQNLITQALQKLAVEHNLVLPEHLTVNIERPRDPSHGDFSSNIAMLLAKVFKLSPLDLAKIIVNFIPQDSSITLSSIAAPGFINFTLSMDFLQYHLEEMSSDPKFGVITTPNIKVVIDYSSPNLAKEMHVGHLRSTIIGDAIANILEFKGMTVIKQNHVGDFGTQFGMLIAYLDDLLQTGKAHIALEDLEVFYVAAKQRFDNDANFADCARSFVVRLQQGDKYCLELWHKFIDVSLSHCQEIYDRLQVNLTAENLRPESAYEKDLDPMVAKLAALQLLTYDDGAACVFLDEFKAKSGDILPIIVQKKDGGFLYATTDLAAIEYRAQNLQADIILYVVDARQELHLAQVFSLARKAGLVKASVLLEHIAFGMVLGADNKPFKSRDGGTVKLAALLDESQRRAQIVISAKNPNLAQAEMQHIVNTIAIASVKYADLAKNRISNYIFDYDAMLSFEGNTAPYLLYAYTRIQSLLRKSAVASEFTKVKFNLTSSHEISLAKHLLKFTEAFESSLVKYQPNLLCNYLFELATMFSAFYEHCQILREAEFKLSRLKLAQLTAKVLAAGLGLLGIPILDKM